VSAFRHIPDLLTSRASRGGHSLPGPPRDARDAARTGGTDPNDAGCYFIDDGNGGTSTATVSLTVTSINDAPMAVNDTVTTATAVSLVSMMRGSDDDQG